MEVEKGSRELDKSPEKEGQNWEIDIRKLNMKYIFAKGNFGCAAPPPIRLFLPRAPPDPNHDCPPGKRSARSHSEVWLASWMGTPVAVKLLLYAIAPFLVLRTCSLIFARSTALPFNAGPLCSSTPSWSIVLLMRFT